MAPDPLSIGTPVRSADGALGVVIDLLDTTPDQTGVDCYMVEAVRAGRPMGPEVWGITGTRAVSDPCDIELLRTLGLLA